VHGYSPSHRPPELSVKVLIKKLRAILDRRKAPDDDDTKDCPKCKTANLARSGLCRHCGWVF